MGQVKSQNFSPSELIRDVMSNEFRESGKVQWTRREIGSALKSNSTYLTDVQLANGLARLKKVGEAATTGIAGGNGNAKYWALTSVLERVTEPESDDDRPTENQQKQLARLDEIEAGVTSESEFTKVTKPETPAVTHADLDNLSASLTKEFEKQIHLAFADFRKSLDNKLTGIAAPKYDDDFNKIRNLLEAEDKLDKEVFTQIVTTVERIFRRLDQIGDATHTLFEEVNKADEIDKEAFQRGFTAGWIACNDKVLEIAKSGLQKGKPEGSITVIPTDEESMRRLQQLKNALGIK